MVDQGKTLNTALSGFAEGHLKEAFDFINAKDNYLPQQTGLKYFLLSLEKKNYPTTL